jgi:hypothetical protein
MAGTAFDFVRIEIPCMSCGRDSHQPIRDLAANDNNVVCTSCSNPIDVSSQEWQAFIAEAADTFKKIQILKPLPRWQVP